MIDWKRTGFLSISAWTFGRIEIQFQWMKERPPFDDEAKRQELRDRLNQIPGVEIPADAIGRRPSIQLSTLTNQNSLDQFLKVLDWFVQEVKNPANMKPWDEESLFRILRNRLDKSLADGVWQVYEWAGKAGLRFRWSDVQTPFFYLGLNHHGKENWFIKVFASKNPYFEIQFGRLKDVPLFRLPTKRLDFLNRLNAIPGISIPAEAADKYPGVQLASLLNNGSLEKFMETLGWLISEIKAA